ncbi:helix-turn-helix domain-containing protein [Parapedobacter sp. 10938]|uniref:helix-turn-helix domain-containing protein n=1 Tax=Parapedobacter flavus TaxID=3110225 RepID=UPI002DB8B53D|nr:helix-turn-helix transcriptional regulator [Parapedobacter sp. 10938]MEC3882076.1 helix-turn-helix transcriptional regulator [Parapedobacter sp. 10938]
METGNIIRTSREEKGWSQGELATDSGVSCEMIGKHERGDAVSSIEAAKKLARALGVTLDYPWGETDGPAFDWKTAELMKDVGTLAEGNREHVFVLLNAFVAKGKLQAILKKHLSS